VRSAAFFGALLLPVAGIGFRVPGWERIHHSQLSEREACTGQRWSRRADAAAHAVASAAAHAAADAQQERKSSGPKPLTPNPRA